MSKFFKPYYLLVTSVGIVTSMYFLYIKHFELSLYALMGMTISIVCSIYEYRGMKNVGFSLATPTSMLLLISFGPAIAIIVNTINMVIMGIDRVRVKLAPPKRLIVSTIFNISQLNITIVVVWLFSTAINLDIYNSKDIWKIALLTATFAFINYLFVFLIVSFQRGKWCNDVFNLRKTYIYNFYILVSTISLIYLFADRNVIGLLLVYSMFIPMQKTSSMYSQLKYQEEELFIDALTKIYNYKFFEHVLNNKLEKKENFSFIMMDLDKFKKINDTYGHEAGNVALQEFSKLLKSKINKEDVLFRYGGDEFGIIINNPERAKEIANSIAHEGGKTKVEYQGETIHLNFSIGLYNHELHHQITPQELVKKPDKAMYESKKQGGNVVIVYEEEKV